MIGRFKSSRSRMSGELVLFDLEADPAESRDVSSENPQVVALHRARADEIAGRLRAGKSSSGELTDGDRKRLHTLGYLE